jgi:hypothetical protein
MSTAASSSTGQLSTASCAVVSDLFVEVGITSSTAAAGGDAALVQANRTNDIVFVCGNNSHGECGVGNQRKVQTPMPLRLAMGRKC